MQGILVIIALNSVPNALFTLDSSLQMVKNGTHLFIDKVLLTLDKFAFIPEVETEMAIDVSHIYL